MAQDAVTALKTLYGIIFVLIWAVVGWITACYGQNIADL